MSPHNSKGTSLIVIAFPYTGVNHNKKSIKWYADKTTQANTGIDLSWKHH